MEASAGDAMAKDDVPKGTRFVNGEHLMASHTEPTEQL